MQRGSNSTNQRASYKLTKPARLRVYIRQMYWDTTCKSGSRQTINRLLVSRELAHLPKGDRRGHILPQSPVMEPFPFLAGVQASLTYTLWFIIHSLHWPVQGGHNTGLTPPSHSTTSPSLAWVLGLSWARLRRVKYTRMGAELSFPTWRRRRALARGGSCATLYSLLPSLNFLK